MAELLAPASVQAKHHDIRQLQRRKTIAQRSIHFVAGICQYAMPSSSLVHWRLDLRQGNLPLDGELHLLGNGGMLAPQRIIRPHLGQVQLQGHGDAGLCTGQRDAHCHYLACLLNWPQY